MMVHIARDVTTEEWYVFSTEEKMNAFTLAKGEGKFVGTSVVVNAVEDWVGAKVYIARSIKTNKWYAFSTREKMDAFTTSREDGPFVVSEEEVDKHKLGRNKMTRFQTYVANATATVATDGVRLGQALMTELPSELYQKYTGSGLDCFYNDEKVGNFLNAVYYDFQPVLVNIWAKESVWVHRQVELNCSLAEAKEFEDSASFEECIDTYVDVLHEEPCDDCDVEWDLDSMVEEA